MGSEYLLNNEDETRSYAEGLANRLVRPLSIGFEGPLGAGKTTLIRYLVKALGSREEVSSPSYVLEHQYKSPAGIIEHWDLYRLEQLPEELWEAPESQGLRLIEWPNKIPEAMSLIDLHIKISFISSESAEGCKVKPENINKARRVVEDFLTTGKRSRGWVSD